MTDKAQLGVDQLDHAHNGRRAGQVCTKVFFFFGRHIFTGRSKSPFPVGANPIFTSDRNILIGKPSRISGQARSVIKSKQAT